MPSSSQDHQRRSTPIEALPPGVWITADQKAEQMGRSRRTVSHWCRHYGNRRGDAVLVRTYRSCPRWYVRVEAPLIRRRPETSPPMAWLARWLVLPPDVDRAEVFGEM
jgi:hypothetical protein